MGMLLRRYHKVSNLNVNENTNTDENLNVNENTEGKEVVKDAGENSESNSEDNE